ncbi:IS21-like element ISAar36 family transposase [Glutamicibacter arilaitensis]|uniref:IS21-like element ISAar36 family transposase n=1 Tax=Glutamicibacter arilaitensis TaxID=256701 RepID=UPI003FD4769D
MVRKIQTKPILRLRSEGFSQRSISTSQGFSRRSVAAVFEAADREQLDWEAARDIPESTVYDRLFPGRGTHTSVFVQPDWARVHQELAKVGVTLKLLHSEYVDQHFRPDTPTMGYDRFCKTYQRFVSESNVASRVEHKAGMSVEVDWSGPTMTLTDPLTGAPSKVYLFVACLPFSRYAFVESTLNMNQDSWLRAHVSMFEAFTGSVPRIVPDNLKTGVTRHPTEGEIVLNDAYRHMAAHYSAAVLPGRVRKPKDKASVENTVGHIATWVIAGLRHSTYTSLNELRQAIRERVHAYNAQPFQKRAGSRTSVFREQEQPLLHPLPAVPYVISTWVYGRKVAKNSYVSYKRNYYSVPVAHLGASVDLRVTDTVLEIFKGHQRLGSHVLLSAQSVNQYQTNDSDIPAEHRFTQWDPQRVREWAQRCGVQTLEVVDRIFAAVQVQEQGINPALAVLRLSRKYSSDRLDAACRIALESAINSPRYAHLEPILKTGQDKNLIAEVPVVADSGGYVRGSAYYDGGQR